MIEKLMMIYKCEFCRKPYQVKSACEKHEPICSKNPAVIRPCHSCRFLCKKDCVIYFDHPMGGEDSYTYSLLYCNKKEIHLITPKVQAKGEWFETDPIPNEFMPLECSERQAPDGYISIDY